MILIHILMNLFLKLDIFFQKLDELKKNLLLNLICVFY